MLVTFVTTRVRSGTLTLFARRHRPGADGPTSAAARALPHRGGAPLDRAPSCPPRILLACSSQEERLTQTLLVVVIERRIVQLPARQDEAALVEFDGTLEPTGVGLRADEDKSARPRVRRSPERLSSITTPFRRSSPVSSLTPGADQQFDVRGVRNPVDEVPRHVLA